MKNFETLQVGGSYRDTEGYIHTIIKKEEGKKESHPFRTKDDCRYSKEGWNAGYREDLVERVTVTPYTTTAPKRKVEDLGKYEAINCKTREDLEEILKAFSKIGINPAFEVDIVWFKYRERTCVFRKLAYLYYGDVTHYSDLEISSVPASDFLPAESPVPVPEVAPALSFPRKMLVWDDNEALAYEAVVLEYEAGSEIPYIVASRSQSGYWSLLRTENAKELDGTPYNPAPQPESEAKPEPAAPTEFKPGVVQLRNGLQVTVTTCEVHIVGRPILVLENEDYRWPANGRHSVIQDHLSNLDIVRQISVADTEPFTPSENECPFEACIREYFGLNPDLDIEKPIPEGADFGQLVNLLAFYHKKTHGKQAIADAEPEAKAEVEDKKRWWISNVEGGPMGYCSWHRAKEDAINCAKSDAPCEVYEVKLVATVSVKSEITVTEL